MGIFHSWSSFSLLAIYDAGHQDDLERSVRYFHRDRVLIRFGRVGAKKNFTPGATQMCDQQNGVRMALGKAGKNQQNGSFFAHFWGRVWKSADEATVFFVASFQTVVLLPSCVCWIMIHPNWGTTS